MQCGHVLGVCFCVVETLSSVSCQCFLSASSSILHFLAIALPLRAQNSSVPQIFPTAEWRLLTAPTGLASHTLLFLFLLLILLFVLVYFLLMKHSQSGVVYNLSTACMYVYLSDDNFQRPWCRKFISVRLIHLRRLGVRSWA